MSFWNFLGKLALLNMICKLFSGRSESNRTTTAQPQYDYIPNPEYEARIEELEQEIRESERRIE